jgi:hypothetical protein
MKSITQNKKSIYFFSKGLIAVIFIAGLLTFSGIISTLNAQDKVFTKATWWFGFAGGANYNFYHGSLQEFNNDFSIPVSFQDTKGVGYFAFPVVEYHHPDAMLGFVLHSGYDGRRGLFEQDITTKLAYITIEPSLRLNLFKTSLFLYTGPRIAYNVDRRFLIGQGVYTFEKMKQFLVSMQVQVSGQDPIVFVYWV